MSNIQRKIYFDISTGNVIIDTGERSGDVVDTTTEQDFENFVELTGRVPETVGMLRVPYGSEADKFVKYYYHIDPTTVEIVWDLTSDQQAERALQKTLEDKLLDMENQVNLQRQTHDATQKTLDGLIDYMTQTGLL